MLTITRFYAIAYPRVKNEVKRPTNSQLTWTLFCSWISKQLSTKVRFQIRHLQLAIIFSILNHFFRYFSCARVSMCSYSLPCVKPVCQTTIFQPSRFESFLKWETQLRSSWHWSSCWEVWKLDLLWTLTKHFGKNLNFGFLLNFKNVPFFASLRLKLSSSINTSLSFNLPKLSTNSSSWSVKLVRNSRPVKCWLKRRTFFLFASEEEGIIYVMKNVQQSHGQQTKNARQRNAHLAYQ